MKPFLACDADLNKLKFPLIAQPKIDGVRGLVQQVENVPSLLGRSLKAIPNVHVSKQFSREQYVGIDGELAASVPTDPDLCRKTTSLVGSRDKPGRAFLHAFDDFTDPTLPYWRRLENLVQRLKEGAPFYVIPTNYVNVGHLDDLLALEADWLARGYEGVILRSPDAPYKFGRCTVGEGAFLRIKRFTDAEAEILSFEEGKTNLNEAKINELGLTERSSHQENLVPNGTVGVMNCRDLKTNQVIKVSPGKMTMEETKFYFQHPEKLIGRITKYKFFGHGVFQKPRFATHQSFRDPVDMGE